MVLTYPTEGQPRAPWLEVDDMIPTSRLRWIYKDGQRVLQQLWIQGTTQEWRDVPDVDATEP